MPTVTFVDHQEEVACCTFGDLPEGGFIDLVLSAAGR